MKLDLANVHNYVRLIKYITYLHINKILAS